MYSDRLLLLLLLLELLELLLLDQSIPIHFPPTPDSNTSSPRHTQAHTRTSEGAIRDGLSIVQRLLLLQVIANRTNGG
uniref:Putative secreted peptide n=1 Tax=Anopheles braziliensis TaxID=58242 RepID=A0A2M3ZPV0_9DIPT